MDVTVEKTLRGKGIRQVVNLEAQSYRKSYMIETNIEYRKNLDFIGTPKITTNL